MIESVVPRAFRGLGVLAIFLLAPIVAGCSGDTGTVASKPASGTVEPSPTKGSPRMPRGPEGVKELQDKTSKK